MQENKNQIIEMFFYVIIINVIMTSILSMYFETRIFIFSTRNAKHFQGFDKLFSYYFIECMANGAN